MTRSLARILLLAVAIVVGFVAVVSSRDRIGDDGRVRVGGQVDRSPDVGPDELAPLDPVTDGGRRGRDAAVDPSEPSDVDPAGGARGGALTAVILAPPSFPAERHELVTVLPVVDDETGRVDTDRAPTGSTPEGVLADGVWRFEGLEPGFWRVDVMLAAAGRNAVGASTRALVVDGEEVGPLAVSVAEYSVDVRVVDSDGAPIQGITVSATYRGTDWRAGSGGGGSSGLRTDADGRVRVPAFGPGEVEVRVPAIGDGEQVVSRWTRTKSTVVLTDRAPAGTLDVRLARVASLEGLMTFTGGGAASLLRVNVRDASGSTRTAEADAGGLFVVTEIPPGESIVHATARDEQGGQQTLWQVVELAPGERKEVEWALEPSRTLTGEVVDRRGRPVADTVVVASAALAPELRSTAKTNARGRFEITRLHPCRYALRVAERDLAAPVEVDLSAQAGPVDIGRLTTGD